MNFIKKNAVLMILFVAVWVSGGALMMVSQKVYHAQKNVKNLSQDILQTEWELRALRAEIAFLSRPERLDQLASAMAYSVSPTAEIRMQIAPVSYQLPDARDLAIVPHRKPSVQNVAYRAPVQTQPTPVLKTAKIIEDKHPIQQASNGFGSLLDKLGGGE